jgi:hypothetical protein
MDSVVDYLSDDESDSEMPASCVSLFERICLIETFFGVQNLEVSNPVREVICKMLDNYLNDEKTNTEIEFPSSLFCHERIFVRQQAQKRNLVCRTFG